MPIKLSSAFLIRVQLSFSAKKNYSLIDFLAKAMFRQMVLRIIWLLFFKLLRLSDRDIWETWIGKSRRCLRWRPAAQGTAVPVQPLSAVGGCRHHTLLAPAKPFKSACWYVTGFVRDSQKLHGGFVPGVMGLSALQCGTQPGKEQGLLVGMWVQPGHCLKMVSELFQGGKKKKSWKKIPPTCMKKYF